MTENQFSVREQDVIASLMQGKSNKEIALTLGIANRTVEYHLGNIYAKLGITSRTEAVIKLSKYRLWKPTGEAGTTNQWNPQLNKVDNGVILTKVFYHPYHSRRNSMKTFVRISILVLVAHPASNFNDWSIFFNTANPQFLGRTHDLNCIERIYFDLKPYRSGSQSVQRTIGIPWHFEHFPHISRILLSKRLHARPTAANVNR